MDHDPLVEMWQKWVILHKFYENIEITLSRAKAISERCEKLFVDCEVTFAAPEQYAGQLNSAIDNLEVAYKDRRWIE